jgi:hypothetical protein
LTVKLARGLSESKHPVPFLGYEKFVGVRDILTMPISGKLDF